MKNFNREALARSHLQASVVLTFSCSGSLAGQEMYMARPVWCSRNLGVALTQDDLRPALCGRVDETPVVN
jgi:hypothetical protein